MCRPHRSRSRSPVRERVRRRSRSRSSERPLDITEMSYDEYLAAFTRVRCCRIVQPCYYGHASCVQLGVLHASGRHQLLLDLYCMLNNPLERKGTLTKLSSATLQLVRRRVDGTEASLLPFSLCSSILKASHMDLSPSLRVRRCSANASGRLQLMRRAALRAVR